MKTEDTLIKRDITLKKAMYVIIILCCLDMTITYFAINRQMQKYPTTWREKELSFVVGPMLRYTTLGTIPILIIGTIINSTLYTLAIKKFRTEFVYGLMFGAVMLAVLSNARIAWLT